MSWASLPVKLPGGLVVIRSDLRGRRRLEVELTGQLNRRERVMHGVIEVGTKTDAFL